MKERVLLALLIASGVVYLIFTKIDSIILLKTLGKSFYISCPALILAGVAIKIKKKIYTNVLIIGLIFIGIIGGRLAIATKNYDLQGMMMAAIAELSLAYIVYVLVKGHPEKEATENTANTR